MRASRIIRNSATRQATLTVRKATLEADWAGLRYFTSPRPSELGFRPTLSALISASLNCRACCGVSAFSELLEMSAYSQCR